MSFLHVSVSELFLRVAGAKNLDQRQKKSLKQGCQVVYFRAKNPNFVIFWMACSGKSWYILWSFVLFYVRTLGKYVKF
jgi:hypothetical protein